MLFGSAKSIFGSEAMDLGGVRVATMGSVAVIQQVTPIIAALDGEGKTVDPIEVKYKLIAPPAALSDGRVLLLRDDQVIGSYPAEELTEGTHTMTIPAGVSLETPPENVDISIRRPDGTLTSPFKTVIRNPDPTAPPLSGGGQAVAPSVFSGVSPNQAVLGSAEVLVTVSGSNLGALSKAYVRAVGGEWSSVDTASRKPNQVTLKLPAAALNQEGFIQISPIEDERVSLAFLVSTTGLPAVGSSADIRVDGVSPDELGVGGQVLHVSGQGFVDGMKLVLGRNGKAGLALATTFVSDTDLEAELPVRFVGHAEDLLVAVLAADNLSLSRSLPLTSTVSDLVDPATQFAEGDIGVTSIEGDIQWGDDAQELEVKGVGLEVGMEVVFTTRRGSQTSTYSAPLRAGSFVVTVPAPVKRYPTFSVQFVALASARQPFASASSYFVPQETFLVPFGGQAKFLIKKDTRAERLYIVKTQRMGKGLVRPSSTRNLVLPRLGHDPLATLVISNNPLDPRSRPSLQLERELFEPDPAAVYLRGLQLTKDPDTGTSYGLATIKAASGALSTQMQVEVVELALGTTNNRHDSSIVKVANRYGIPPHFLKSQVEHESAFRDKSFRYEPWTIDLKVLTGDGTIRDKFGRRLVYGDAEHDQSKRWIEQYPFDKYIIGGTANAAPLATTPMVFSLSACPLTNPKPPCASATVTEFVIYSGGAVLGREKMPASGTGWASRVQASIAGGERALNRNPIPIQNRWSKAWGTYGSPGPPAPSDWSIDYRTGRLWLYEPLAPGETLTVTFEPVGTVSFGTGAFGAPPVASFDLAKVKEVVKLVYAPGESVGSWFTRNLSRQAVVNPKARRGNFFGTASEAFTEFFDATNDPIDTRLHVATAQYYAASSYGPLQVTLQPWLESDKKRLFDTVLKVEEVPLYRLASDWDQAWDRGLSLGAAFHEGTLKRLSLACTSCDTRSWERTWSRVFWEYNRAGPKYRINTSDPSKELDTSEIIRKARKYEPF